MATQLITSRQNRWFVRFREARRRHRDEIVLEGPKFLRDAIASGWDPVAVAIDEEAVPDVGVVSTFRFAGTLFREISDTVSSQGVVALFRRPSHDVEALFGRGGLVVALDGVQDPGNVGTIIRLAAAFEASLVLALEGTADPYGPKAVRATAGTLFRVATAETTRSNLARLIGSHDRPCYVAAADGERGELPEGDAVLLLGSEGAGVSSGLAAIGRPLAIAMSHGVESLNVAAAAAILLHGRYARGIGTGS